MNGVMWSVNTKFGYFRELSEVMAPCLYINLNKIRKEKDPCIKEQPCKNMSQI